MVIFIAKEKLDEKKLILVLVLQSGFTLNSFFWFRNGVLKIKGRSAKRKKRWSKRS